MKKLIFAFAIFGIFLLFLAGCAENSNQMTGKATEGAELCYDSDDGVDIYVKGIITMGNKIFADKCYGNFLVEYYCENNEIKNMNFNCEKGCSNGRCIK